MFGPERGYIPRRAKELLYAEQKGRCMYCGVKRPIGELHLDHKTPVARDGTDSIGNLQLLCGPCNTCKGSTTDGEFRRKYKLTPARDATGPPSKVIERSYFDEITKATAKRRAQRSAREDSLW